MNKIIFALVLLSVSTVSGCVFENTAPDTTPMVRETDNFIFHYIAKDSSAVDEMSAVLMDNYQRILDILGVDLPFAVEVHVYPSLEDFHQGVGRPDSPDWFVGAVHGGRVIHIVSPNNPGPVHSHDAIIKVAAHEFVHVAAHQLSSHQIIPYLVEGLAMYLANQCKGVHEAVASLSTASALPDAVRILQTMQFTENVFSVGYVFVEFIIYEFGFDKLIEMYTSTNPLGVFEITNDELNQKWADFIAEHVIVN